MNHLFLFIQYSIPKLSIPKLKIINKLQFVYLKSRPLMITLTSISLIISIGTTFISPNQIFEDIPPSSYSNRFNAFGIKIPFNIFNNTYLIFRSIYDFFSIICYLFPFFFTPQILVKILNYNLLQFLEPNI